MALQARGAKSGSQVEYGAAKRERQSGKLFGRQTDLDPVDSGSILDCRLVAHHSKAEDFQAGVAYRFPVASRGCTSCSKRGFRT
jgi:hypothetical protein